MLERFVPIDFVAPMKTHINEEYFVEALTTKYVIEDWQTILGNAETIQKIRGTSHLVSRSEWPYSCTLEENYKDLAWLEICASYKQLFSYVLRRQKDNIYSGCIYMYPITLFYPEKAKYYDVDLSYWITEKEFIEGKYDRISLALHTWVRGAWPFEKGRIYFRNVLKPTWYNEQK